MRSAPSDAPPRGSLSAPSLFLAPLLLGRHVERVTLRLILGATLVVAGSVLVVISLSG